MTQSTPNLNYKPRCIFCGSDTGPFNDEHHFPKWLIKMTGDPGRKGNALGYNSFIPKTTSVRKPLMSRTTPSCTTCNNSWSLLETQAEIAMKNISEDGAASRVQLSILFDWMDKVRLGYWHHCMFVTKNIYNINPKFYINNYVGKHDSFLWLFRSSTQPVDGIHYRHKALMCSCDHTFMMHPGTIHLVVNNLVLVQGCDTSYGYTRLENTDECGEFILKFREKLQSKDIWLKTPYSSRANILFRPGTSRPSICGDIGKDVAGYANMLDPVVYAIGQYGMSRISDQLLFYSTHNRAGDIAESIRLYYRVRRDSISTFLNNQRPFQQIGQQSISIEKREKFGLIL